MIIVSVIIAISNQKFIVLEIALYLLLLIGIGLSVFQVIIEYNLYEYHSNCTQTLDNINSAEDFFNAINAKDLIACNIPALIIFGISLAGWNGLYMLGMLCIIFFMRYKKNS